jgi:hypothetical protein
MEGLDRDLQARGAEAPAAMSSVPEFVAPADAYPGFSRFQADLLWSGDEEGPAKLFSWWRLGQIPREEFIRLIPEVWVKAESPVRCLGERSWLAMFKDAGFVSDCGAMPPTGPVTLYRGADEPHMRGFSWTPDVRDASWFADRTTWTSPGLVFAATVPPGAVLGEFVGRNEPELVVNPNCLWGPATPRIVENAPRFPTGPDGAS